MDCIASVGGVRCPPHLKWGGHELKPGDYVVSTSLTSYTPSKSAFEDKFSPPVTLLQVEEVNDNGEKKMKVIGTKEINWNEFVKLKDDESVSRHIFCLAFLFDFNFSFKEHHAIINERFVCDTKLTKLELPERNKRLHKRASKEGFEIPPLQNKEIASQPQPDDIKFSPPAGASC
jgi:hypothetical protein